MALTAQTNGDLQKYVSDKDPAKTKVKEPNDPNDATKGEKEVTKIDWENATIFYIRPLDVQLMGSIYDNATALSGRQGEQEIGIHTRVHKTNIEAVKFGLGKWENFPDDTGKLQHIELEETTFNRKKYMVVTDRSIDMLGIQLVGELANEIKRISEVGTVAAKNLEKAS